MKSLVPIVLLAAYYFAGASAEEKRTGEKGEKIALGQVLEYLSGAAKTNIRARDAKLEKLPVAMPLALTEKTTWRTVLEDVCRENRLRIDDSLANVLLIWQPQRVSCAFRDADVREVLYTLAMQANLNIIIDEDVKGTVTARYEDVDWDVALGAIVKSTGHVAVIGKDGVHRIGK